MTDNYISSNHPNDKLKENIKNLPKKAISSFYSYSKPKSLFFEFLGGETSTSSEEDLNLNNSSTIESQIKFYEDQILSIDEAFLFGLISEKKHEKKINNFENKLRELRCLYE